MEKIQAMPLTNFARAVDLTRAKRLLDVVRRAFYTVSVPDASGFVIAEMTPDEVEVLLREEGFFEETQMAYYYDGEVANLRRPGGINDEGRYMELHARLFLTADGETFAQVHHEASRYEEYDAHISERDFSWEAGRRRFAAILDRHDVSYDSAQPSVL